MSADREPCMQTTKDTTTLGMPASCWQQQRLRYQRQECYQQQEGHWNRDNRHDACIRETPATAMTPVTAGTPALAWMQAIAWMPAKSWTPSTTGKQMIEKVHIFKVPKCEIFDILHTWDFYTKKSHLVCNFKAEIKFLFLFFNIWARCVSFYLC